MYRIRTLITGVAGSPWYTNLYFDQATGTPQQAVDAVQAFWSGNATTLAAPATWVVDGIVPVIDSATGDTISTFAVTQKTGTFSNSAGRAPSSLQGLARFRTGAYIGGREVRGRFFIPGFTIGAIGPGGSVSTAQVAQQNSLLATLVGTANADLVVWSKTNGQFFPVSAATLWDQFAVLRSRRD